MRRKLRGWTGDRVQVSVNGTRTDWENGGTVRKYRERRSLVLNRYRDIFGPQGALLEMCKDQLSKRSMPELAITEIIISRE